MPRAPGHGPIWSLTKAAAGTTITKIIPAGPAVDQTHHQIAEYRRFRALVCDLVDASEDCGAASGSRA